MHDAVTKIADTQRQILPDFVKAFAIITVVWGHAIQYWHGVEFDFWRDYIFVWIYSFHMPLFAIVSGYLFSRSYYRHGGREIIYSKIRQLIIPCISWGIIFSLVEAMISYSFGSSTSGLRVIKNIILEIINDYWFLKAIFCCSILVLVVEKKANHKKLLYIIMVACTMLVPDIFGMASYAFLFPYFVIGFSYGKFYEHVHIENKILCSSLFLHIIMILFWKKQYYIYKWDEYF